MQQSAILILFHAHYLNHKEEVSGTSANCVNLWFYSVFEQINLQNT